MHPHPFACDDLSALVSRSLLSLARLLHTVSIAPRTNPIAVVAVATAICVVVARINHRTAFTTNVSARAAAFDVTLVFASTVIVAAPFVASIAARFAIARADGEFPIVAVVAVVAAVAAPSAARTAWLASRARRSIRTRRRRFARRASRAARARCVVTRRASHLARVAPMLRGARAATNATRATNATNVARARVRARSAYDVARTFVARVDAGAGERGATVALSEALRAHLPSEYASATSAKREIRRKNVLVNGAVRAVGDAVADGDVVEVLARTRPSSAGGGGAPSGRAGRRGGAERTEHFAIVVKPDDCASVGKGKRSDEVERGAAVRDGADADAGGRRRRVVEASAGAPVGRTHGRIAGVREDADGDDGSCRRRSRSEQCGKGIGRCCEDASNRRRGWSTSRSAVWRALTEYSVVREYESEEYGGILTLIDFFPKTGRTHQLRRHAKALCAPILGDVKYDHAIARSRGRLVSVGHWHRASAERHALARRRLW